MKGIVKVLIPSNTFTLLFVGRWHSLLRFSLSQNEQTMYLHYLFHVRSETSMRCVNVVSECFQDAKLMKKIERLVVSLILEKQSVVVVVIVNRKRVRQ